jgi:hypothetical protein
MENVKNGVHKDQTYHILLVINSCWTVSGALREPGHHPPHPVHWSIAYISHTPLEQPVQLDGEVCPHNFGQHEGRKSASEVNPPLEVRIFKKLQNSEPLRAINKQLVRTRTDHSSWIPTRTRTNLRCFHGYHKTHLDQQIQLIQNPRSSRPALFVVRFVTVEHKTSIMPRRLTWAGIQPCHVIAAFASRACVISRWRLYNKKYTVTRLHVGLLGAVSGPERSHGGSAVRLVNV